MAKTGVAFNKQSSRKPIVNPNYLVCDPNSYIDNLEKSKFNSSKYARTRVVDFDKQSAREKGDSRLPSFMDGIHTRSSIGNLNRKTYELNHFDESNFRSQVDVKRKTLSFSSSMYLSRAKLGQTRLSLGNSDLKRSSPGKTSKLLSSL